MPTEDTQQFNIKEYKIHYDDKGQFTEEGILMGIMNHTKLNGSGGIGEAGNFSFSGNEGSKQEVCKACYQAFRQAGASDAAAKGILANIAVESGFDPRVITWDGNGTRFGFGGGLCGFYRFGALPELAKDCGWSMTQVEELDNKIRHSGLPYPTKACHPANAKHIKNLVGGFPFSLQQQLNHLTSLPYFNDIKSYTDPNQAAMMWEKKYERPAKITNRWQSHGSFVMKLLNT